MDKLIELIKSDIPTPLCEKLFNKLLTTKFINDPASYKYHHVYKHGLLIHSYELFKLLCQLVNENESIVGRVDKDTLFLIAFGHDLEKIGTYKFNFSTNTYDYIFHKMNKMTHGEYGFNKLCEYLGDEFNSHKDYELIKICIHGHMGDYERTKRGKQFYHDNVDKYPLLWLTHMADAKSCELNGQDYLYLLEDHKYKLTDEEYHNIIDPIDELGSMS